MQENASDPHPLSDLAYDWITLMQNKAQALIAYDQYIKDAEAAIVAAENELKKTIEAIQAREPGLKEQEAALQAQVADAEKFLPPDAAGVYLRLVQAHGADALAAVENSCCGSCYVKLTSQNLLELRTGKALFCKSCGRLLYLADET